MARDKDVSQGEVGPCSPFLIVSDVGASVAHYVDQLGFDCRYQTPEDAPFFAIVGRGAAQIMLKAVGDVLPVPNAQRHADAPWDVFVFAAHPDALLAEFGDVPLHRPLGDRDDGLRGFEVADPDGYICFFGCPN